MTGDRPAQQHLAKLLADHPKLAPCRQQLAAACDLLISAYHQGHKLLLCGNGGSAADCEHIAGELLKGCERRRPLPADLRSKLAAQGPDGEALAARLQQALPTISLPGHLGLATAFANDVDPEMVFAQLVTALGSPGDVLLCLSTSGRSRNLLLAARAARALGLHTLALTGTDGGALAPLCDLAILVPADTTAEVQELHLPVYHYLCRAVEAHFFPE